MRPSTCCYHCGTPKSFASIYQNRVFFSPLRSKFPTCVVSSSGSCLYTWLGHCHRSYRSPPNNILNPYYAYYRIIDRNQLSYHFPRALWLGYYIIIHPRQTNLIEILHSSLRARFACIASSNPSQDKSYHFPRGWLHWQFIMISIKHYTYIWLMFQFAWRLQHATTISF